jgi:hypothetical protein
MKTNTINEGKGDEITKNMLENRRLVNADYSKFIKNAQTYKQNYLYISLLNIRCVSFP